MTRTKPKDHIDLNLPKPETPRRKIEERETIRASAGQKSALSDIGKRFEGLDGKRYVGSFATHVYVVEGLLGRKYVTVAQTTDLTEVPENIAHFAIAELGRATMKRFGHKPPRYRDDPAEAEDKIQ